MFPEIQKTYSNQKGIGLIAAIFVIVILALFGLLIARYTMTTAISSAEDYLWAKTYYAVESGIRLRMLEDDGGGNWAGWTGYPLVDGTAITEISASLQPIGQPSSIRAQGSQNDIVRELTVKFVK
jgi:hypothetical protein